MTDYPVVLDPKTVGTYPPNVFSGGGFVYDAVLEYRVWKYGEAGLELHAFSDADAAIKFHNNTPQDDRPTIVVLVLQNAWIKEHRPYFHSVEHSMRLTEWRLDWLCGNKRGVDVDINRLCEKLNKAQEN